MLSRVAEHLYWLSRYIERAEATARLATAASDTILDLPTTIPYDWESLMLVFDPASELGDVGESEVMRLLMIDRENHSSIRSSIAYARENARVTRDLIPKDAWVSLNELHGLVERQSLSTLDRTARSRLLRQVIAGCRLWHGCLMSNMARDLGWAFLQLGDRIEHVDMLSRMIDPRVTQIAPGGSAQWASYEALGWQNVLTAIGGYELYRHTTRDRLRGESILQFVLRDRQFPQSMTASLLSIRSDLAMLPHQRVQPKLVDGLIAGLESLSLDRLSPDLLTESMDWVQQGLSELHHQISASYFYFVDDSAASTSIEGLVAIQ